MNILDELEARGQVAEITHRDELLELLEGDVPIPFYAGFDPTAPSMHLGHIIPIMLMTRLQRAGHKPIAVVGGATGMIGDPSGKSDERQLLDAETLERNCAAIREQLSHVMTFGDGPTDAVLVNNADWFANIGYIDFLRDIGKLLTVNYMTNKESVRARLDDREQGISYTEFSYMLLQSYDFVHLAEHHGCRLQVGGSDQWGNVTAGCELQRKMGRPSLFGLVAPLLLDSSGQKMGKTSKGERIWLDPALTSPYALYQYWMNLADADVDRMLKTFSFRSLEEIAEIVAAHTEAPHKRIGQKAIAEEFTAWLHGEDALKRVLAATQVMFGGKLDELSDSDLEPLLSDVPSSELGRDQLSGGVELVELLATTGLAKSKGEARRLIKGGGVYINNVSEADPARSVTDADLGTETMLVLRAGKKRYHIVRVR
jgi:tyrosyl-tRNA synthetase